MKNKKFTVLAIFLSLSILSGCSAKSTSQTNQTSLTKANSVEKKSDVKSETTKSPFNNVVITPVPEAEKIPKEYYDAINTKNYDLAKSLLGPTLAFMGDDSMRKYWINLEHIEMTNFKDISDKVTSLDPQQQKYYSIKVYYANLNIKVKDPKLVPGLNSLQTRKFTVVKVNKDSKWVLDGDEDTDKIN